MSMTHMIDNLPEGESLNNLLMPSFGTPTSTMQEKFPNSFVYGKMGSSAFIEMAPILAMRLLLGATVTPCPAGENEVYNVTLNNNDYILYADDFHRIEKLSVFFITSWLRRKGFQTKGDIPFLLRSNPDLITIGIEFLRYCLTEADENTNSQKLKIFWSVPDEYACGYYRAKLPASYSMSDGCGIEIHSYPSRFMSYSQLSYYDAFVFHRSPPATIIDFFQKMKLQNKVVVLDCDDDLENIPEWSYAKQFIGNPDLKRRVAAIETADICTATNKHLAGKFPLQKKVNVCPNLVDFNFYQLPDQSTKPRKLQKEFVGFKLAQTTSGQLKVYNPSSGKELKNAEELGRSYNPIIICWFGSPTHDEDLEIVINPIKKLVKKYQSAVRFVFFGYWPIEFVDMRVGAGNSSPTVEVKPEYNGSIMIYPGVPHHDFPAYFKEINPDIGLCPLAEHEFNLSKSNIKALEFGVLGVPSICTDYGPYQFINHGEDGLLVKSESEWHAAIEKLITNHELRSELGMNIRKRVMKEYSWHTDNENRRCWDRHFQDIADLVRDGKEHVKEDIL